MQGKGRSIISYIKIIMLVIVMIGSTVTTGEQLYNYQANTKIKGVISSKNANRLQFASKPILQVIGDESKYSFLQDFQAINLFISPKVKIGEQIELALIDTAGKVADLLLQVADISGQVIIINDAKESRVSSAEEDTQQLKRIIRYMMHSNLGEDKYYVTQVKRELNLPTGKNIKIVQDRTYRYLEYVGARLKVTNLNSKKQKSFNIISADTIELQQALFASLFNAEKIAVRYQKQKLKPQESCYVWLAVKEKKDD